MRTSESVHLRMVARAAQRFAEARDGGGERR
jgi:hypothetical protein